MPEEENFQEGDQEFKKVPLKERCPFCGDDAHIEGKICKNCYLKLLAPRKTESIEVKEGSLKLPDWVLTLLLNSKEGQLEAVFNDVDSILIRRIS